MENIIQELRAQFSSAYLCRNDPALTLAGDITTLAGLLGYAPEEISSVFQNSLLAMVSADTRQNLRSSLAGQIAETGEVECIVPLCRKNGDTVWFLNRAVCREASDGQAYICGILVEISRLKQEYDLEKQATFTWEEEAKRDSLTHVYNACTARKLAETFIAESPDNIAALLIIDLDDFKKVNDRYGHLFGDAVLVQAAKIIRNLFRSKDIVGRIGGEEFMVLMKGTTDLNIISNRCRKLNEKLGNMFGDEVPGCSPSCSIGVALLPCHADSYFRLFRCADQALYYAKGQGKKQYALYDPENNSMISGSSSLLYMEYDENMLHGYIDSNIPPHFSDHT